MSFLNYGPAGFYNAPLSKGLIGLTVGTTLVGSLVGTRNQGSSVLGYDDLFTASWNWGQMWRLFTGPFTLTSMGELIFCSLLLYLFRLFERQWGTHKFSVFVLHSTLTSFVLQLSSKLLFNTSLLSGPYGLIFSCFVQYVLDIPATNSFRLLGVGFSEKVFVYLLALQLLVASFPSSLIIGACGIFAGLIYRSKYLRISHIKFPGFVTRFCSRFVLPLLRTPLWRRPAAPTAQRSGASRRVNSIRAAPAARHPTPHPQPAAPEGAAQGWADTLLSNSGLSRPPPQPVPMPAQEDIQALEQMGFNREAATAALRSVHNDVHQAVALLVDGHH